jgi:FkbM family methyltransferase
MGQHLLAGAQADSRRLGQARQRRCGLMPPAVASIDGSVVSFTVERRPVRFFVKNRADVIQGHHYRGEFYEPDELAMMADVIRPGSVIVDIGSNVGNHAVYFDKFLAAREIILFEVNPEAIAILLLNQALNGCTSWNTGYLRYALSNKFAAISIVSARPDNLGGTKFREDDAGDLRCMPGDSVLATRPIDFIKLDVEGSEIAVLAGLKETIRRWRPTLFVEVLSRNLPAFEAFLVHHAYDIAREFTRYPGFTNYLIVPRTADSCSATASNLPNSPLS